MPTSEPASERTPERSLNELEGDPDALRVRGTVPGALLEAWDFVAVPGWFVNQGELREHVVTALEPGRHLVQDPDFGNFVFEEVEVHPPTAYVVRGSHTSGATDAPTTTVTFRLREAPDAPSGTEVVITETGFAGLGLDAAATRASIEENVRAWLLELRLAARALAPPAQ